MTIPRIADGFLKIVRGEGPVLDHRAFKVYSKAAGLGRTSAAIRDRYQKALERLVDRGLITARSDDLKDPDSLRVYRPVDTPPVQIRGRGDRSLDEIPLAEITGLIRKLELTRGEAYEDEEHRFRRILEVYELLRLTSKSKSRLRLARERADLPNWSRATRESAESGAESGPAPRRRKPRRRLRHG